MDGAAARLSARGEEFGVKGIKMTMGSPIPKDFVASADSVMVERLRKAGVIFIGKTNAPEFGLGSHTYNHVYGVTRNAYDQSRSAGGSSGGAAEDRPPSRRASALRSGPARHIPVAVRRSG
jgi:hypothetical protein